MQRHHWQTRRVDRFDTELICADCHGNLHALFDNRQLASELNTVEALRAHPVFAKALAFIRKQPPESKTRVKSAKRRRR
jgi:hypothetical protein